MSEKNFAFWNSDDYKSRLKFLDMTIAKLEKMRSDTRSFTETLFYKHRNLSKIAWDRLTSIIILSGKEKRNLRRLN